MLIKFFTFLISPLIQILNMRQVRAGLSVLSVNRHKLL